MSPERRKTPREPGSIPRERPTVPVEPTTPEMTTPGGLRYREYRGTDGSLWRCVEANAVPTWTRLPSASDVRRAASLLPLVEGCVICANEGRHEPDRPHVYEGQE